MSVEQTKAATMESVEYTSSKLLPDLSKPQPTSSDRPMPNTPPSRHTSTASIKNCWRISAWRAPTAMRTPISRVRSVTETSMMFITPMPPTISEMRAIAEISSVMVCVVLSIVWRMVSVLSTKKSCTPWRCKSSRLTPCSAASADTSSLMRTVMLRKWLCPVTRLMAAVYGIHTLSASELPKADSLRLATPTTRQGTWPSKITSPTGLGLRGKSCLRVLSSMTTSCARLATLSSSKVRPAAICTPRTRKYCSPTPLMLPVTAMLP